MMSVFIYSTYYQFIFTTAHIPGVNNVAADALSLSLPTIYPVSLNLPSGPAAHYPPHSSRVVPTADPRLELRRLNDSVQKLLAAGLTAATVRSYQSGCSHFVPFCNCIKLSLFPLCESILFRFVAFLVNQHLTIGTIQLYLSALRLHQIEGGGSDLSMADIPQMHCLMRDCTNCRGLRTLFVFQSP